MYFHTVVSFDDVFITIEYKKRANEIGGGGDSGGDSGGDVDDDGVTVTLRS